MCIRDRCTWHSELVGSAKHPTKGALVFARGSISTGTLIAEFAMEDVVTSTMNMPGFEALLAEMEPAEAQELLRHSCPNGSGLVCLQDGCHWNALLNHSSAPSVKQSCERYTADTVQLVAAHDIEPGDELTVDYDQSVGYELHSQEPLMARFLELCLEHRVCKQPSSLTSPPVKVTVLQPLAGTIVFVYSTEFEASRTFYEQALGLQLKDDRGFVVFYSLPGTANSLGVVSQGVSAAEVPPCTPTQCGRDTVMLCLLVSDVVGMFGRLSGMGYKFDQPPAINDRFGIHNALLRDPDGYLVEIQQFIDPVEQAQFTS
eukprot:TRINITY_DN23329_c0_g1_i1.p1 TRINITY_DN23329_c0_g1~~TRINITY_DN23329_c0_g1_i1.p1  ORF type:complete len:316 (+),score=66.96 TRINITY_DN23329_c0_g1_i1:115-1062(+)